MQNSHPYSSGVYLNGRLAIYANHCEYKDGSVDLHWNIDFDDWYVGAICKNYDDDFYQLALTVYGDYTDEPKFLYLFKDIYKEKFNSIEEVIYNMMIQINKYGKQ